MTICEIDRNLYRIKIPFEKIYTIVYVVLREEGAAVIDSGTTVEDVDTCILPALEKLGVNEKTLKYLLLTHSHRDHAGGISHLSACFPKAVVGASYPLNLPNRLLLQDGQILLDGLQVVSLPGHTENSVGFLELSTGTLLSGDCLQLLGVDKYRSGIGYPALYRQSVEKLQHLPLKRIAAAHEYDPYGSLAEGEEAVRKYLDFCLQHDHNIAL